MTQLTYEQMIWIESVIYIANEHQLQQIELILCDAKKALGLLQ